MADVPLSPEAFIANYPSEAIVVVSNGKKMTLGQALAFEELFCTADQERRQDPANRVSYLARILAAGGSLRAEDHQYLPEEVE